MQCFIFALFCFYSVKIVGLIEKLRKQGKENLFKRICNVIQNRSEMLGKGELMNF